jgi:hypothetical protein
MGLSTRACADQVLREHDSYLSGKLAKASTKIKQELKRIARAGKHDKAQVPSKKAEIEDVSVILETMTLEDLSTYVSNQTKALKDAHVTLEERRSKGLHKVSAGTQKFLSEFGRFVDAYSGIVDIVMLVDSQHGGVACTTLALLFSVRIAPNRGY